MRVCACKGVLECVSVELLAGLCSYFPVRSFALSFLLTLSISHWLGNNKKEGRVGGGKVSKKS